MSVTVGEIVKVLNTWAPLSLKESWDNPGLLIGNPDETVDKVLVTLDVMTDTVDYAVEQGVKLIVSHHPVIFDGLKSLRTDTYNGAMYQKLLAHHIAVYSAHTNLDSADGGVNDVLAGLLGLTDIEGLVPVSEDKLYKIAVYVPESHGDALRKALADSGAGYIGKYSDCSFTTKGEGRFKAHEGANPFIGTVGKVETAAEERIETIVPERGLKTVLQAMIAAHPYEEPAYDIYPLKNAGHAFTMGRVGNWPTPEPAMAVLQKIKDILHRDALSYAGNTDVTVRRVALLGGGGAGFIKMAKNAGADLYLTGDVKYHDAQEAFKQGLVVVDGGHFGTESPVVDDLCRRLQAASEERQWGIDCRRDPTSQDMIQYLI
ncbi:Nif3-like dinuclear metal center hexameric protein [Megasphaera sp. DISK 18]|uniref:Nif3-like dinuclear metal center hexameric protein n=1 Tax=Megasphaera sp. DISK 18 TaxID=1776081 RepID=UPI000807033F|nr:Nif3-like dinuclear metal center hexameric protein [Megasphaera sp. DISK 18]OBZ34001.1 Nif3-like dinuclear metal center hexameric protein [Megasphaera sp. DISK 18]